MGWIRSRSFPATWTAPHRRHCNTYLKQRDKTILVFAGAALAGTVLLFGLVTWFLWRDTITNEQEKVAAVAQTLGRNTERVMEDARDTLKSLNKLPAQGCSKAQLQAMEQAAIGHPYIRAIGYWHAATRLCGVGFLQTGALKPQHADHIYKSGVIAWWPSPQTEVNGVQLFLMRYGDYDLAIDPRTLLQTAPMKGYKIGLWVQGLRMAASPWGAKLPPPSSLKSGLTVDSKHDRLISRVSLDSVFPIDIVAVQPTSSLWGLYRHTLELAVLVGLVLAALWVYGIWRYGRYRLSLSVELREALRKHRVRVRYQPVIDLESGRCVGAEALARWVRDDGELVDQDLFIRVAEAAGLGRMLTENVLKAILDELGGLLREQPHLSINLNMTPQDLESHAFQDLLSASLESAGIGPHSIKLEITERALVNNADVRALIRSFRELGHQVAVDDFGTGYSSLSYLESFELDTMKIDKSFVNAIGRETVTSQVILHVIEMAKDLGLDIVAEGTETLEQVQWLSRQGVQYGQGFYFSEPLAADAFREFVGNNQAKVRPFIPALKRRQN